MASIHGHMNGIIPWLQIDAGPGKHGADFHPILKLDLKAEKDILSLSFYAALQRKRNLFPIVADRILAIVNTQGADKKRIVASNIRVILFPV